MVLTVEQEQRIFRAMKSLLAPKAEIVSICGWCPDARQRTAALVAEGKCVSHGMCPSCAAKMESELGS